MRNELNTSSYVITTTDDGTNKLLLDGTEISSDEWVGTGSYVNGNITIDKVESLDGNIILKKITASHYTLVIINSSRYILNKMILDRVARRLRMIGGSMLGTKTVTANGTYSASSDSLDGYSSVTVNVQPKLTTGYASKAGTYTPSSSYDGFSKFTVSIPLTTKTITENGTYTPSSSYRGFSSVTVNVPSQQPNLGSKTITSDGVYSAQDDGLDGYSEVTVNASILLPIYAIIAHRNWVNNGVWTIQEADNNCKSIIFEVEAGIEYTIQLGQNVGNRFRAMFSTVDLSKATSNVTGTAIINTNSVSAMQQVKYTPPSNGYIAVMVTNNAEYDVMAYVIKYPVLSGIDDTGNTY